MDKGTLKRSTPISIIAGLAIMIACNVVGHYRPPFSLMTSFIYMNIIFGVCHNNLYERGFKLTIAYNFMLLLVNDLLIRLYAGGRHDAEGMRWCYFVFIITYTITVCTMLILSWVSLRSRKDILMNIATIIVAGVVTLLVYDNFNRFI